MLQFGWLWPCPQILRPDWKGFSKNKRSSLLGLVVSDKEKSFITSTPGLQHGPHLPVHMVRLQDQVSKL